MNNVIERKWCTKGTVYIEDLTGTAFTGEDGGHTFVISGVNPDGTAVTLAGTVAGAYILPDGSTQPLTGSIADGKAQITLDPECYALPGRGQLTIFLMASGQKVAIYGAVLNVARSSTDQVPPAITADVADLVNDIEEARATIPASYTNLMASLAKNYADLIYPISTGTYAWQDGWMYRAKVDIPSTESWTASHWEKVPLADSLVDELSALKSAINVLEDRTEYKQLLNGWDTVEYEYGKYINSSGGETRGTFQSTGYIPVTAGDEISYKLYGYSTDVWIITGYDSSKTRVADNSLVGETGWKTGTYTVAEGTAFIRICSSDPSSAEFSSSDTYGTVAIPIKTHVDNGLAGKINTMQSSADAGKALVIGNDGTVVPENITIEVDDTLTQKGEAADAKAVGDALSELMIYKKLDGWNSVKWTTGYINSNGTITPNASFRSTEFIPVSEGDVINYKLKGYSTLVYIVTGYDSTKTRIASSAVVGTSSFIESTYTVPSDVAYVRLSSGTVNEAIFSSETVDGTIIENTKQYIDNADAEINERIDGVENELGDFDGIDTIRQYYTLSPNLFDQTKVTPAPSLGTGYVWSDHMPVVAGERYTLWADGAVYTLIWYDSTKTKISQIIVNGKGFEKTAPIGAAFACLGYKESGITKIMFAHGVVGDYVPYGVLVPIKATPDYVVRDTNNIYDPSKYVYATNISTSDGSVYAYSSSQSTDFIPVEKGETYYIGGENDGSINITGGAAYDEDYVFVEAITSNTYTASERVAFIRISYSIPGGNFIAPCVRKGQTGVTGLNSFDAYDTFRIVNTKPTEFERASSLYGLKWNAMGDSITEGSGTTKSYQSFIRDRTGVIPHSYGVSNTAIARRGQSYTNDMCIRYADMTNDADIVTVFGGTNDHGNNIPIGQWGDDTPDTLYGAMKILIEGLVGKYMGKKIGFILPLPKYNTTSNTDFSYPSESFKPYIDCIADCCKRYSIPYLDLYTESGISVAMASVRAAMIPDGLHPNAVGHELISWQIQRFLERL